ncbi:hypothetical protein LOZ12_004745 [Ophidiomyces ophidiicola]|uniref:Uncharacterized protein n=1 Tax=Ophidiomyces ophidiicola TaxID=1387563 RepID=A0ACB8UR38_9EURO|nr:hypothetical protein LOZ64_005082 [Ophidiomyces ophidiicola]KAI1938405.1 hypothetical protein LOZ62_005239 [Ophidiomyces ophidiicola]KAI1969479.1 hypothetical protein LOZ56_004419 [Ophidiomyces ophidiicola]KAI2000320.1 hypothetical protein LOZ50_006012 [Ophidiomyces ophidiicola]KAI2022698.1 hypothetical protein LOZ46_001839 [Ophidiomyces ophidiicola]
MESSKKGVQDVYLHDLDRDYYGTTASDDGSISPSTRDFSHFSNRNIHQNRYAGTKSHRSSISSLPGSVLIHAQANIPSGEDDHHSSTVERSHYPDKKNRQLSFVTRGRDGDCPFRNPSSVRAMQMGDEDSELDAFSPAHMTLRARKQRESFRAQSPSISEISMPMHSGAASPSSSMQKYCRSLPQMVLEEETKRDYPLVLLHCTLLPPSLLLPTRMGTPNSELLQEVLPDIYWRRWKLLEDKVSASGVLRDRGVLISHPQEVYDLLEERLLESLELIRPRLAYGHFLGVEDGTDSYTKEHKDESGCTVIDSGDGAKCDDCGRHIINTSESEERKWEVRIYAANGLMRAGAWAAAWRDMEKVDVEVGLWLPSDIRRELERRMAEEDIFRLEAELRSVDDKRSQKMSGTNSSSAEASRQPSHHKIQETQRQLPKLSYVGWVRRFAIDFPSKKFQGLGIQPRFQFEQFSLFDPAVSLISAIILTLAFSYGCFGGPSTWVTHTPTTAEPQNVVTVTAYHTLPMHTTTVFASASTSSTLPRSASITVSVNGSTFRSDMTSKIEENKVGLPTALEPVLDVESYRTTACSDDDILLPTCPSPREKNLESTTGLSVGDTVNAKGDNQKETVYYGTEPNAIV